jgi:ABC-type Na+ efflux pump permease subunit
MTTAASTTPTRMSAIARVFDLSVGQMLWSRRSLLLALLVTAPVLLALLLRFATLDIAVRGARGPFVARMGGPGLFGAMLWLFYIRFIVPLLGVFYGTALIADEVEDKTITYLFSRPIPRGAILVGKYLAYLVCTTLLVCPSVVIVYFLLVPIGNGSIGAAFPALVADLGMLAAGLIAYGALFSWAGSRLSRPLTAGLVFTFVWEPAVLLFPGYAKRLTVAYYLQALVPHAMPSDSRISLFLEVIQDPLPVGVSVVSLAVITALALWGAVRAIESREYVIEQ